MEPHIHTGLGVADDAALNPPVGARKDDDVFEGFARARIETRDTTINLAVDRGLRSCCSTAIRRPT